jgi:fructokinase
MNDTTYGGIEAGGTKFICAVATQPDTVLAQTEIPTTTPEETLARVVAFFAAQPPVQAVGIGCFGPVDIDLASPTYGHILDTPKVSWSNLDIVGQFSQALKVPISIDTDVNAAALGELRHGAGKDLTALTYMTVGTGIGIGHATSGEVKVASHDTEGGHMLISRLPEDTFTSACPYHESCLEGLASGFALQQRAGVSADKIAADDPIWQLETTYLAYGISNTILMEMPAKIIVGGGVMTHDSLLQTVQQAVLNQLNSYSIGATLANSIEDYLVRPELGKLSGVIGALELAATKS